MAGSAFKMKLKKGFEAEYKKRHDEIWPDVALSVRPGNDDLATLALGHKPVA